jgi:predicted RND superfamily exporter protein
LAMALATSSPLESMGLMLAFGLGTSPALILVVGLGRVIRLGPGWGRRIKVASVYVCSGLLILRGMGLGIPYLSPVQDALQLEKSSTENSSCECHRKD